MKHISKFNNPKILSKNINEKIYHHINCFYQELGFSIHYIFLLEKDYYECIEYRNSYTRLSLNNYVKNNFYKGQHLTFFGVNIEKIKKNIDIPEHLILGYYYQQENDFERVYFIE